VEKNSFPIVMRKISELIPAEYNPRRLTEKQFTDLKKSMQKLGTLEPAVINTFPGRENVIISGHQRLRVAESLGMKEYPCLEVRFDPRTEREANIRMNRNGGEWDMDALGNAFDVKDLLEWGFESGEFGIGDPDILEDISLPDGAKGDLENMTFSVTGEQAEQIRRAIEIAKDMGEFIDTGNENGNGNALARIAETFSGDHGKR
jgi:hypothetical protein